MKTKIQTVKEAEQALRQAEYAIRSRKTDLAAAVAREIHPTIWCGTWKLREVLKERFPKTRFNNDYLSAVCNRWGYE